MHKAESQKSGSKSILCDWIMFICFLMCYVFHRTHTCMHTTWLKIIHCIKSNHQTCTVISHSLIKAHCKSVATAWGCIVVYSSLASCGKKKKHNPKTLLMHCDEYDTFHPPLHCLNNVYPLGPCLSVSTVPTGLIICSSGVGVLVALMSDLMEAEEDRQQWTQREASGGQSALTNLIYSDKPDWPVQGRHVKYDLAVMLQLSKQN